MSVALVDVAGLVAIVATVATVESVKADIEDVKWETQRKAVLLVNLPPHSAAGLAGAVVPLLKELL